MIYATGARAMHHQTAQPFNSGSPVQCTCIIFRNTDERDFITRRRINFTRVFNMEKFSKKRFLVFLREDPLNFDVI